MASAVPHVFIYEYPALGGPPLGTLDAAEELLEDQAALQAFGACVGLLAVPEEDEGYAIVGGVFRHDHERSTWALHVLVRWQGQGLALQRDEVAQVLTNGAYFRERHAEEPWIDFFDVALWLQYESNYSLIFLMDEIARAFLPAQYQERAFRLLQALWPAIERNHRFERQALRRAFTKALPHLLPGAQIARKKPGYARGKGHAHFFLTAKGHLEPAQLLPEPVSRSGVESLREAIQGYRSPRGYFFAPALEADVILDNNMIFVPFGSRAAQRRTLMSNENLHGPM